MSRPDTRDDPPATAPSWVASSEIASHVTAFIQAGGQSTRMGRSKAHLPLGSRRCIEHVATVAHQVIGRVIIVATHREEFEFLGLAVVSDRETGCGPLGGLVTALRWCPTPWALNLACDLPFVTEGLLRVLISHAHTGDAVVPLDAAGQPQPLCALYAVTCLPWASDLLRQGERSLRSLLSLIRVRFIPFDEISELSGSSDFFFDIDSPADYERARKMMAHREGFDWA